MTRAILLLLLAIPPVARAQTRPPVLPPLLPIEREIALAESAAPPDVARDASVWVLRRGGYILGRAGTNGFACLVERSHPLGLEPICYDAEGADTLLPVMLESAALREQGLDSAAVALAVADGYRTGRFRAPRRTGVAFMLSTETRFHDAATGASIPVPPHLMFYAPYLTNRDIGSPGEDRAGPHRPFVIEEGRPNAYIVVMVGGSDGAARD
jgi:hypothetical protein